MNSWHRDDEAAWAFKSPQLNTWIQKETQNYNTVLERRYLHVVVLAESLNIKGLGLINRVVTKRRGGACADF